MKASRPYGGSTCDRQEHRLPYMRLIKPGDDRMHACGCGSTLIGNGVVILREKVLDQRFPNQRSAA